MTLQRQSGSFYFLEAQSLQGIIFFYFYLSILIIIKVRIKIRSAGRASVMISSADQTNLLFSYILKIRNRNMQTQNQADVIHVEFCRNCETHNWNTHHDEQKYVTFFRKFTRFIAKHFPNLKVVGNAVPAHFVAFDEAECKYYDTKAKKYVNYPQIGAFEVVFNNKVLFSKKKTNAWPDFRQIGHKVAQITRENTGGSQEGALNFQQSIGQNNRVEPANAQQEATDQQTITFATNENYDNDDKRTTYYKAKQSKNFTLTDHFKIYKMQKQEEIEKQKAKKLRNEKSEPSLKIFSSEDERSHHGRHDWQNVRFKTEIPSFIKQKGYINEDKGKKQMIINLDSIEEETFVEDGAMSRRDNDKKKQNGMQVIKKWGEELNFLQNKFDTVEKSLSKIKNKKKQLEQYEEPNLQQWLQKMDTAEAGVKKNHNFEFPKSKRVANISPIEVKSTPPLQLMTKVNKIDEYIQSSPKQKNRKLQQIYGETRLIKNQLYLVQPRYLKQNRKITYEPKQQSISKKQNKAKKQNNYRSSCMHNQVEQSEDEEHSSRQPRVVQSNSEATLRNNNHKYRIKIKNQAETVDPSKEASVEKKNYSNTKVINNGSEKSSQMESQVNFYKISREKEPKNHRVEGNSTVRALSSSKKKDDKAHSAAKRDNFIRTSLKWSEGLEKINKSKNQQSNRIEKNSYNLQNMGKVSRPPKPKIPKAKINSITPIKFQSEVQHNQGEQADKSLEPFNIQDYEKAESDSELKVSQTMQRFDNLHKRIHEGVKKVRKQSRKNQRSYEKYKDFHNLASLDNEVDSSEISQSAGSNQQQKTLRKINGDAEADHENTKLIQKPQKKQKSRYKKTKSNLKQGTIQNDKEKIDKTRNFRLPNKHKSKTQQSSQQFMAIPQNGHEQAHNNRQSDYERSDDSSAIISYPANQQPDSNQGQESFMNQSQDKPTQKNKALPISPVSNENRPLPVIKTYDDDEEQVEKKEVTFKQLQTVNVANKAPQEGQQTRPPTRTKNNNKIEKVFELVTAGSATKSRFIDETPVIKDQLNGQNEQRQSSNQEQNFSNKCGKPFEQTPDKCRDGIEQEISNQHMQQQLSKSNDSQRADVIQQLKVETSESKQLVAKQVKQHPKSASPQDQNKERCSNTQISEKQILYQVKEQAQQGQMTQMPNIKPSTQIKIKVYDDHGESLPNQSAATQKANVEQEIQQRTIDLERNSRKDINTLKQHTKETAEIDKKQSATNDIGGTNKQISTEKKFAKQQPVKAQEVQQFQPQSVKAIETNQKKQQHVNLPEARQSLHQPANLQDIKQLGKHPANSSEVDEQIKSEEVVQTSPQHQNTKETKNIELKQPELKQDEALKQVGKAEQFLQQKKAEFINNEEVKQPANAKEIKQSVRSQDKKNPSKVEEHVAKEIKDPAQVEEVKQQEVQTVKAQEAKQTAKAEEAKQPEVQTVKAEEAKQTAKAEEAKQTVKAEEAKQTVKAEEAKQTVKAEEAKQPEVQTVKAEEAKQTAKADEAKQPEVHATKAEVVKQSDPSPVSDSDVQQPQPLVVTVMKANQEKQQPVNSEEVSLLQKRSPQLSQPNKSQLLSQGPAFIINSSPISLQKGSVQTFEHDHPLKNQPPLENPISKDSRNNINSEVHLAYDQQSVNSLKQSNNFKLPQQADKKQQSLLKSSHDSMKAKRQALQYVTTSQHNLEQKPQIRPQPGDIKQEVVQPDCFQAPGINSQPNHIKQQKETSGLRSTHKSHKKKPDQQAQQLKLHQTPHQRQSQAQIRLSPLSKYQVQKVSIGIQKNDTIEAGFQATPEALIGEVVAQHASKQGSSQDSIAEWEKIGGFKAAECQVQQSEIRAAEQEDVRGSTQVAKVNKSLPKQATEKVTEPKPLTTAIPVNQQQQYNPSPNNTLSPTLQPVPAVLQCQQIETSSIQIKQNPSSRPHEQQPGKTATLNSMDSHKTSCDILPITSNLNNSKGSSGTLQARDESEEVVLEERAKITEQLFGDQNGQEKQVFGNTQLKLARYRLAKQLPQQTQRLGKLYPDACIFSPDGLNLNDVNSNSPNSQPLLKAIKILSHLNNYLLIRLFQNRDQPLKHNKSGLHGVWLCDHYQWKCFIVDDCIEIGQTRSPFTHGGDPSRHIWLYLLEKAVALCLGGPQIMREMEAGKMVHMLTGSNVLSYKVREDPEKNGKLLQAIRNCAGKNFYMHCEKSQSNVKNLHKQTQHKQPIYSIQNIKTVNSEQKVIQVREWTDEKETRFWMKLQKFLQQFRLVQIVQLRMNHNACTLGLKNGRGTFSIIYLQFVQESFGSISVANKHKPGYIKAYLYREQKSNTLKLVGQAKQKCKNQLFFDCMFSHGRYYLFVQVEAQGSVVSYSGEGFPTVQLKQEVNVQGYKNDYTEYLPISVENNKEMSAFRGVGSGITARNEGEYSEIGRSRSPMFQYKQSQLSKISELRENFINYLLEEQRSRLG